MNIFPVMVAFIGGMLFVILADAISEWLYAKADELREKTETHRAERVKKELEHEQPR